MRNAEAADSAVLSVPAFDDIYPRNGELVDSLTPVLRAWGQSTSGSSVSYSFKVCDDESMSGTGCTASGYVAGNRNNWSVPAGKLAWGKQYWWQVTARDNLDSSTTTSPVLTFTTGVRQPAVTSWLGRSGTSGREFDQQSGNYTTSFTDLSVATVGAPLSVVRTYNSMDPRTDGIFGAGWSTRWDMKLVKEVRGAATSALVTYPDGRQVRFRANGDGSFQPPPGMYATLAQQSGGTWKLMDKQATSYLFDDQGRLTKVSDQRNRSQDLTYGSDGKLAKVTGVGGRSLTFTWTGSHVQTVSSDAVDGKPLTWTYGYEDNRLTQVCAPVAAPNCTSIEYGSGSLYRSGVLNTDPVGYWRLGEATGTTAEDAGTSGGDATYQGVTLAQQGALTGTSDTAAKFGPGAVVKLPSHTIARLGDQMSVEAWFKTSQSGVILAAGTGESSGIAKGAMVYVGTDGKLRGSLDAVTAPITSAQPVNNDQWHHVTLTVSGANQTLFLDGQQVGTMTGQVTAWRQFASVGNGVTDPAKSPAVPSTSQAFPFQGTIDEVAVYGAPLTAAEVQGHYAARGGAPYKLSKITLPSGRVWASNTYDDKTDRIATHVDNHGGTWKIGPISVQQEYGEAQVTVTDPGNKTLKYLYDAWRGYRIRGETDQLDKTTWYEYDQAGFLTKVIDRNDIANEIYQDKRGNTLGRQYCRAPGECAIEFWTYYLNANDSFDPRNDQLIAYRDGRSASDTDNTFATVTEYNSFGEQTKQTSPATTDFPNGRSTSIAYTDGTEPAVGGGTTPAGLVAKKTDARSNSWTYRYTAAGDLAEQTNPAGLVTKLDYDAIGRLLASTQVSQAHPDGVKTTFTYDGLSRLVTQTEPGVKNEVSGVTHTKQTTFGYDPDGNQLSEKVADLTGGDAERTTTYTYDTHGRQDSITDPEGGVVRQDWNQRGWVTRVTDARGTVIDNGYTDRGELATRTLKGWTDSPVNPQPAKDVVLESRGYDPAGRLTSTVDAMGRKTTNVYWMDNRLKQKIADDAKLNGATTTGDVVLEAHEYDPAGNLVEQTTGGGLTTTIYDYDAASRLIDQILDPDKLARKTAFAYDANGNVLRKTLTGAGTSRAEVTEYVYDKMNLATKTTVENGADDLVSTSDYDDRGLVVAATDPRGNATGADKAAFTSTLRYDAMGRLVEATGPQVKVDKAGSSSDVRPSARYGYDTFGATTHERDAEGRTITSVFDKAGRLASKSAPPYTPPGGAVITPTTSHGYDKAGQLIRTTDPRGFTSTFEYDQLGRQVRVTDPAPEGETPGRWVAEYDLAGEQRAAVDPTGARTEATYDDLGRKITETQVERKPSAAAYVTKLEYDDAGRLTKSVAPGNRTTTYKVNAAGEMTEQTDPAANTTTTDYDPAGRPTKTTNVALTTATLAEYDLAGRKIAIKDLKGTTVLRTMSTGYDLAGNPTTLTSGEGHVTKQTFDALNRLTSLIEPVKDGETITTSFGYDATGARTRLTDGRGNATWTTYNTLGLVETVTEPSTTAHPDTADRTWTAVYDQAGNPTALIQPGGVRIDRTFDHLGRLTKETGSGGGAASAERTFGYDLAGRQTTIGDLTVDYNDRTLPLSIKRGTAQQTGYTYDELGNPTQRVDAAGTATFTWDNAGRLWTATDPVTTRKITYDYDQASRVKTMTAKVGTTSADTQVFTYDDLDRAKTHTLKSSTGTQLAQITYLWDNDDNLTTKTTAGLAGAGTNTYGYDHAGRLTSWTAPGGAKTLYEWDAAGNRTKAGDKTYTYDERNRLTSGDGSTYTYTPRGTLATETKSGATTQLTFDAFDRLIADGDSLYSYDSLDRITTRTRGTTKQTFAYTGLTNHLAAITDTSGAVQAKYGRDAFGGLLGQKEGTNPALSTLTDLHEDLVATYTGTALATTTAYDPFGVVTAQTGVKTTLGYQGAYTDPNTGKVNMHARWYQPGTGSFTSRDTATITPNPSVQANRYTYANASPLTGIDPTGHATVITDGVGSIWDTPSYAGSAVGGAWGAPYGPVRDDYEIGDCTVCLGAGEVEWLAPQVDPEWYFENYVLRDNPLMSDEEAKRTGVMPNGMTAPRGFWDMSAKDRAEFTKIASWVNFINPSITQEELLGVGGRSAAGGKSGPSYYDMYKQLIPYKGNIAKAANYYKVSPTYLVAVLVYELRREETQLFMKHPKTTTELTMAKQGWNGSFGLAQLEPYKVQLAHQHYFHVGISQKQALKMIIRDPFAAAAMYMRFLRDTVKIPTANGGTRNMTWAETAVAYCGCSGATRNSSNLKWTTTKLENWLGGTSAYPQTSSRVEARKRREAMERDGWASNAAIEYWVYA
ncbi:LamG-like jellyroll fold domain-containing protein [Nonomuraea roseoviolacea]|uniref:RHS repeat-associated protein n=1 Tax=Nonomuraea roseoviolacea subsp. carminata TaxID=160689 RepID=A0ABT1K7I8_9ACTN|nr:LamG-like jellyroll fold domain-containing protein [Nonomuraea roseoviolacea]MCP2349885.1 RHS repeat-associated protein [Nonomuraea roseoviolacea subsp. carminata]